MFFPPCPQCQKNTVESAENERFDHAARVIKGRLVANAIAGHPHPVAKVFVSAVMIGRAVYNRWPGGGKKRCTSCGFTFC